MYRSLIPQTSEKSFIGCRHPWICSVSEDIVPEVDGENNIPHLTAMSMTSWILWRHKRQLPLKRPESDWVQMGFRFLLPQEKIEVPLLKSWGIYQGPRLYPAWSVIPYGSKSPVLILVGFSEQIPKDKILIIHCSQTTQTVFVSIYFTCNLYLPTLKIDSANCQGSFLKFSLLLTC